MLTQRRSCPARVRHQSERLAYGASCVLALMACQGPSQNGSAPTASVPTASVPATSDPTDSGPTASAPATSNTPSVEPPRVLVFSKTVEYRHASIAVAVSALHAIASNAGWQIESSEDAASFNTESLGAFDVVVFASTTGDVLDAAQQGALEAFIRAGNGYVGIHAASDTEYDWPWYGALVGAYFKAHPAIQVADVHVVNDTHPSTQHLPAVWQRTDEWYGFRAQPDASVDVLLRLAEDSYDPGEGAMGEQHPIAWAHEYDGGRAFYTALGHTEESYQDPLFLTHLQKAIEWAAGATPQASSPARALAARFTWSLFSTK